MSARHPNPGEIQKPLAGKTDAITGRFFGPKPDVEELYDTQTDPHCIHNPIEDPAHAQRLAKMRQALRDWQLHVHDSGLIPEEELYRRSTSSTVSGRCRCPCPLELPGTEKSLNDPHFLVDAAL